MDNSMMYKRFEGNCRIDFYDDVLHGSIMFIDDLVTYEATTPVKLVEAFHDVVDDYIEITYTTIGE